jgi:hypothetical protein
MSERPDRDGELIKLSAGEIRHLIASLIQPQHDGDHYQRWSRWRRKHQARAKRCHYQRRLASIAA